MRLKAFRFISISHAALVLGLTVAHILEIPGKRQLLGEDWLFI